MRCALAMVDAKRGRRKRYGQKNAWDAAAERGTVCGRSPYVLPARFRGVLAT
jgi:hypothetical protein